KTPTWARPPAPVLTTTSGTRSPFTSPTATRTLPRKPGNGRNRNTSAPVVWSRTTTSGMPWKRVTRGMNTGGTPAKTPGRGTWVPVPLSAGPPAGTGAGALLTVTVTAGDVVVWPAASVASAAQVWRPLPTVVESQENV